MLFGLSSNPSSAQNLDSLYTVWQDNSVSDSLRVGAYGEYIWNGFLFTRPDSAFALAEEMIRFSEERNYPLGSSKALRVQGISHAIRGNHDEALRCYEGSKAISDSVGDVKGSAGIIMNIGILRGSQGDYRGALSSYEEALAIYEEIEDLVGISKTTNNIGGIYHDQGDYIKALQYYQRSLVTYDELGDKFQKAGTLNNIGLIYAQQGDTEQALNYTEQALDIRETIVDKRGLAVSYNNLGLIYEMEEEYPKALEYYELSGQLRRETNDQGGLAGVYNNIGLIYSHQEEYDKALDFYQQSLVIREEINERKAIAFTLRCIGSAYLGKEMYPEAIKNCSEALSIAQEIGVLLEQKDACQCLYDANKAVGNDNEALFYFELKQTAEDSLQEIETMKELQRMEFKKIMTQDSITKAEEALRVEAEYQEEVSSEKRSKMWSIAGAVFFLVLAGGFFARWRYVRKSKAKLQIEKERSEDILHNILPENIAEELKEKGEADAKDYDMVTVLFTDFKGFTSASEKLSPQDLVTEINTCFKAFDRIAEKYRIEKIKTIGDAYMAAGGLPEPTETSVKDTVLAAIEMQEYIAQRKVELDEQGLPSFEMRVGVHTGPVVAGIVGVKKYQYDVWGDTVNTASRMESSGEVGRVNISGATYALLQSDASFTFESRGKIEAKGKGEVEMYFVQLKS